MKKQILTDKETKHFLMEAFGCTQQAVWQALTFQRNSEKAQRIRKLALERGGKLVGVNVPECETTHEEAEKTMTMTFGQRVKIVADRKDGTISVLVDGKLKDSYRDMTVPDFMRLQHEVERMAAAL